MIKIEEKKDIAYYIKESIKLKKIIFSSQDGKQIHNAQQGIDLYLRMIDQLIGVKALEELQ